MPDITLSAGVRQNLLSLQQTADLMASTQNRLATGKKVNSALDNPTNFFTSQSLSTRANDLSNLLDGISNATKTLEAADNGISAISKLVESAQSTARQALQDNSTGADTIIEGGSAVDTSSTPAASGSTLQEQVQQQTLNNLGLATGDTIVITTTDTATNTTNQVTYTVGATPANETVQDVIDAINASGVASAEITDAGKFKIATSSNENITLDVTNASGDASTATVQDSGIFAALGFGAAADVNGTNAGGGTNAGADDPQDPGGTDVTFTDGAATGDADDLSITAYGDPSATSNTRTTLASQFNDILTQIDELAADASYNGINLINSAAASLKVAFNEHRDSNKSELEISGKDLTSSGLSLTAATVFTDAEANQALDQLSAALSDLQQAGSTFGSNLATVNIREDFTENMINTLQTGADNLVLADTNEEGANMLALQTRQSLSTTALSLASQADQAVLQLF